MWPQSKPEEVKKVERDTKDRANRAASDAFAAEVTAWAAFNGFMDWDIRVCEWKERTVTLSLDVLESHLQVGFP